MTQARQNQAVWPNQLDSQPRHLRLISPGDVTYALASLFLSGMQLLPASQRIRVIDRSSMFLANLLYAANVHSTKTVRRNLNTVLSPDRSLDAVEGDVRRLLSMTVWNSLIINSLPVLPRSQVVGLARIEGTSCLDDYLASGHPVLTLGYHFGVHPLIVAAILYARGYPVHAVSRVRQMPITAGVFQRLYLRRLRAIGDQLPVIDPREGLKRGMLDVLRSTECLFMTPDYMIPPNERRPDSVFEVPVDFLGRGAYLHTGGLRLAKRLGAKVVTVLSASADEDGRRLIVEPLELPTPGFTPAELQHDLLICIRRLEAQVLAHPHLWLDLKRDDLARRLRKSRTDLSRGKG